MGLSSWISEAGHIRRCEHHSESMLTSTPDAAGLKSANHTWKKQNKDFEKTNTFIQSGPPLKELGSNMNHDKSDWW